MTVQPILAIGNPLLREPGQPVEASDIGSAHIQSLIDDLIETMRDASGANFEVSC